MPPEPPPAITVPGTPGTPPGSPAAVTSPGAVAPTGILLTGTSHGSGALGDRGDADADGRHVYSGTSSQVYWSGGNWVILTPSYGAFKASAALSPVGLTAWTITQGSGQPTITGSALAHPPSIT